MEDPLSPREREVAVLVAGGLTDKEIGRRLFISERTAEGHVERIRRKLGFHSRAQIGGWVVEKGIRADEVVPARPRPSDRRRVRAPLLAGAGLLAGLTVLIGVLALGLGLFPQRQGTPPSAGGHVVVLAQGVVDLDVSIAVDSRGTVYLPRVTNESLVSGSLGELPREPALLKIDSNGLIHTLPDVQVAAHAVALDANGVLYVATFLGDVQRVDGGTLTRVAGCQHTRPDCPEYGVSAPDPVSALARRLHPSAIAFAPTGELYISEFTKISKLTAGGLIYTVAGTGSPGYSGDGGPPLHAQLNRPMGMAFNQDGELYFADMLNNAVRKVARDGTISTVAGTGQAGFSGDGGPATAARLYAPRAVAFDASGDLFISDTENNRVRKVSRSGIISTAVGSGRRGSAVEGRIPTAIELYAPSAIAFDTLGKLYVVDRFNRRVLMITLPERRP